MKKYQNAEMQIIYLNSEDVIVTSGCSYEGEEG